MDINEVEILTNYDTEEEKKNGKIIILSLVTGLMP